MQAEGDDPLGAFNDDDASSRAGTVGKLFAAMFPLGLLSILLTIAAVAGFLFVAQWFFSGCSDPGTSADQREAARRLGVLQQDPMAAPAAIAHATSGGTDSDVGKPFQLAAQHPTQVTRNAVVAGDVKAIGQQLLAEAEAARWSVGADCVNESAVLIFGEKTVDTWTAYLHVTLSQQADMVSVTVNIETPFPSESHGPPATSAERSVACLVG